MHAQPASAIADPTNNGNWEKPTESGPDKEVPGYLVNLGPTGARAILKERSFVVKYVFRNSPAARYLTIDDEITGANGKPFGKHVFGKCYGIKSTEGIEGPLMDFGNAIEDSEGDSGILTLTVLRKGKEKKVKIRLGKTGRFSETWPAKCRKSDRLLLGALRYLLTSKELYRGQCHTKATAGLAFLSQGRIKEARKLALSWNKVPSGDVWSWPVSYQCIFLCEYHLRTRDRKVLKTISELTKILYKGQIVNPADYSSRMHGGEPQGKNFLKGGLGHRIEIDGYGTMTITTLLAMMAWELAEDCGVKVDRERVEMAYECVRTHTHKSGYMGYRFGGGAYSPVGRQGLSILVHKLSEASADTDDYVKLVTGGLVNARNRVNDGHGDNVLSLFWALLGIQASGDAEAARQVLDYNKPLVNLSRTHDGSFVALPCRNTGDKGYYMSSRLHPTAAMILILGMDKPQLRLERGNPSRKK